MTDVALPRRVLRQSTINQADTCGQRLVYAFDENQPRGGGVMRAAGTGYHAGIAEGYLQIKRGEVLDPARMIQAALDEVEQEIQITDNFDWRYQPKTKRQDEIVFERAQLDELVVNTVQRYIDNDYWWPRERYEVLGVELYFRQEFPGVEGWDRTGTMDLVLLDRETNWVHIVDHKMTRKKWYDSKAKPSASVQAAWYVDATKEIFGTDDVTFMYDVIDLAGGFNRIPAHRTKTHIDATMLRARTLIALIENDGPYQPNTQSFLCTEAYCDYWNRCPFGAPLNS
jgi:hypothetical protein